MGSSSSKPYPFGPRTTAEEVAACFPDGVRGKTVMVTGGNSGLGLETARVLAAHGAAVVLTVRNDAKGQAAVEAIKASLPGSSPAVSYLCLDLADLRQVRAALGAYVRGGKPLHVLVNNAGVMACPQGHTVDGFETQFGSNHVGHWAATQALLPALVRSGTPAAPARVINLSSMGHWLFPDPVAGIDMELAFRGAPQYDAWLAYGWSKLANLLHAAELNRRMAAQGAPVVAVSVHPGAILETGLTRHFDAWAVLAMLRYPRVWRALMIRNKTTPEGAATTVLAAVAPLAGTPAAAAVTGTAAGVAVTPGAYYADCAVETSWLHPTALDPAVGARLWQLTEDAVAGALK